MCDQMFPDENFLKEYGWRPAGLVKNDALNPDF